MSNRLPEGNHQVIQYDEKSTVASRFAKSNLLEEFKDRTYISWGQEDSDCHLLPMTIGLPTSDFSDSLEKDEYYQWYGEPLMFRLNETFKSEEIGKFGGGGPYDTYTATFSCAEPYAKQTPKITGYNLAFFYSYDYKAIAPVVDRWYNLYHLPGKIYSPELDYDPKLELRPEYTHFLSHLGQDKVWRKSPDNFNFCFDIRIIPEFVQERDFNSNIGEEQESALSEVTPLPPELANIITEQAEETYLLLHIECIQATCG